MTSVDTLLILTQHLLNTKTHVWGNTNIWDDLTQCEHKIAHNSGDKFLISDLFQQIGEMSPSLPAQFVMNGNQSHLHFSLK